MNENEFSYIMPRKGVCARAVLEFPEMIVLKGFIVAQDEVPSLPDKYRALRHKLVDEGVIGWRDGYFEFLRDYRFKTCSAAACVIEGGSRNGYVVWENSRGQTMSKLGYRK